MSHYKTVLSNIQSIAKDRKIHEDSISWIYTSAKHNYSYNFTWMNSPIIQYPQDIVAMQELIWE